jgi:dimethylglycine dehydrogenase
MKTHARVVVIGGGVVGVSTLYHLAKKGWSDVTLVERTELTAGSTWHAAGLLPLFNMSYTVGQLHKYSVDLYKRLPEETGQEVSFHVTGNLRLATCRDRMDEYQKYCGTANTIGVPFEIISPEEVKKLWPLVNLGDGVNTPKIVGALYHPHDGHIAPVDLTMALRRGARSAGAEIAEQTEVQGVERMPSGEWKILTNRGDIVCEHVVCATGNYARETGRMFGLSVPAIPVEHQYIVYDESKELKAYRDGGGRELRVLRESDASYYLREERMGWILGPYERGAPARFADGVPGSSARSSSRRPRPLLPHVEAAMKRVPCLEHCGHQDDRQRADLVYARTAARWSVRRGDLPTSGSTKGHSFGVTAAGGSDGSSRVDRRGRSGIDMLASIRDATAATRASATPCARTRRRIATSSRSIIRRGARRRASGEDQPVYEKLNAMGAVWGQRYGWERANWFAPRESSGRTHGASAAPTTSSTSATSAGGCAERRRDRPHAVHQARGDGPGSEAWLDQLVANKVPVKPGRIALSHALTQRGGIRSEFTITQLADGISTV